MAIGLEKLGHANNPPESFLASPRNVCDVICTGDNGYLEVKLAFLVLRTNTCTSVIDQLSIRSIDKTIVH